MATVHSGTIDGLRDGDLDLAATLWSGQVFRWVRDTDGVWWSGTVGSRATRLSQSADGSTIYWEASGSDHDDAKRAVRSFLRLDDADLPALAKRWCKRDSLFAEAWAARPGVRILRQDAHECFFSFLCASVAPITRIAGMLRAVASECGEPLANGLIPFPDAQALATISQERWYELGLGFRAKRVAAAARMLAQLPPNHLSDLRRNATHGEAKRELMGFLGVGEKIADCVCLFSLDKDGAVPVDVHIWRVAQSHYAPDLSGKSLTPTNYARAVQAFHDTFGPQAGWAQQILFYRAAVVRRNSRAPEG